MVDMSPYRIARLGNVIIPSSADIDLFSGRPKDLMFYGDELRIMDGQTPGGIKIIGTSVMRLTDAEKNQARLNLGITVAGGIQGLTGLQGVPGTPGTPGAKGDKGDRGERGERGEQGLKGDRGEQGLKGPSLTIQALAEMLVPAFRVLAASLPDEAPTVPGTLYRNGDFIGITPGY